MLCITANVMQNNDLGKIQMKNNFYMAVDCIIMPIQTQAWYLSQLNIQKELNLQEFFLLLREIKWDGTENQIQKYYSCRQKWFQLFWKYYQWALLQLRKHNPGTLLPQRKRCPGALLQQRKSNPGESKNVKFPVLFFLVYCKFEYKQYLIPYDLKWIQLYCSHSVVFHI